MYKCINCSYEGEEIVNNMFCPICGDFIEGYKPEQLKNKRIIIISNKVTDKSYKRILDYVKDLTDDQKRNYTSRKVKK